MMPPVIYRAAAIVRRAAVTLVAGGALFVIVVGTAYVVGADSGELGPAPVVHLTPSPTP